MFHYTIPEQKRQRVSSYFSVAFLMQMLYNMFLVSGCSAAGSAPALGAGCREFESRHSDQKGGMTFVMPPFCIVERLEKLNTSVRWTLVPSRLDGMESLIYRVSPLGPKEGNDFCHFPLLNCSDLKNRNSKCCFCFLLHIWYTLFLNPGRNRLLHRAYADSAYPAIPAAWFPCRA